MIAVCREAVKKLLVRHAKPISRRNRWQTEAKMQVKNTESKKRSGFPT